jgi:hypothetical protein
MPSLSVVALTNINQDDFGGGIYRGRKAPPTALYDCVNGLINDEGLPFRRGGSAYHSASDAPADLRRMIVAYLQAVHANRVLVSTSSGRYVLNGSLAPVASDSRLISSRHASSGNYIAFVNGAAEVVLYAGSLKSTQYATGTVTVTNGSAAVTGSGTSWLANADAGMILFSGVNTPAVVKSIDSDTALTLADPWAGTGAAGAAYSLEISVNISMFGTGATRSFVASAGSGSPRLLWCIGNRVYFTDRGDPTTFTAENYHELPSNALIVGAEGRGDSALIFTTAGAWAIGNLSFDPIDASGNIQHTVQQVNKDVTLWDDYGIAGYAGGLVVPAIDDVFLMGADGLAPVTEAVRPLYRDYVKAGYQTGQGAVHRGHYFLPILNGTTLVDTLICRLDRGAAWTRFAGHAAGAAYGTLIEESARQPKLLGLKGARVTDLTGCFTPAAGNALDADGTTSDMVIITRDYPLGANQPGFAQKLRSRHELVDDGSGGTAAPTVTPAVSSDQDGGTFTTLTERGEQGGATGWGVSDGSVYQWALVGKKRERIRFRLTIAGACASFVLRSIELLMRPSGKQ